METVKAFCVPLIFLLTLQALAGCTGANANPQALTGTGNLGKGATADGPLACERTIPEYAGGELSPSAASAYRCLKEGEFCNPLNDRCCPGLYCPGGLAPRCFRRP